MKKLLIIILVALSVNSYAQFYNGHQMLFGKNRIQYHLFSWQYYRFQRYDVYFYKGGKPLAYFTSKYISEALPEMEHFFDYDLKDRVIFIVYNNLTDFKQTNLGFNTENVNVELPASTRIIDNKVFIYFEGDHNKLKLQVRKALAEIFINQILRGKGFAQKISTSTMSDLPDWYEKGLVLYAADPYNIEAENYVSDKILNSKYINITHIYDKQEAEYIGYSFWSFISDYFGQDVIPNLLYFSRINKNINSAFIFVLGKSLKEINRMWYDYTKEKYEAQAKGKEYPKEEALKKFKKNQAYYQAVYCTKNDKLAYAVNDRGRYKIVIYDTKTSKRKVIYRKGHRLEQITDYTYPVLAWHPSGDRLSFITEEKSQVILTHYDLNTKKYTRSTIPLINKVLSFRYAKNGRYIIFSAIKDGYTDLFLYNDITGSMRRLTNDPYDDLYPSFIDKDTKIIFSSNRTRDSIKRVFRVERADSLSSSFDLYTMDYKKRTKIAKPLVKTPYDNETQAFEIGKDIYTYLSDQNGIVNRFAINYDSAVAFVDTAVHYSYFTTRFPVTNYPVSINGHNLTYRKKYISETMHLNGKDRIYEFKGKFTKDNDLVKNFRYTESRRKQLQVMRRRDSLARLRYLEEQQKKRVTDSVLAIIDSYKPKVKDTAVDINNYSFEMERDSILRIYFYHRLEEKKLKSIRKKWGKIWVYYPTFYLTNFSSTFDYGQLIQSYQPYNGGPFVFGSGFNFFTVTELNEMFGDYRILGGFRMGGDLRSMEYIASLENLKKRLDKQLVFHRASAYQNYGFVGFDYIMTKSVTNEMIYSLRYPFSQIASVKATFLGRYDKQVYLATDLKPLSYDSKYSYYTSAKLEYIFDNTRKLSDNLYDGLRFKIYTEGFKQIKGNQYWTGSSGFDFRYYKDIFRNSIIAFRTAGATSYGTGKIVYYLGSVDNWYVMSIDPQDTKDLMFNSTVKISTDQNYIFQAVATPLRGYKQNIRNGTTFLLTNLEVRMPVFRMILNRPIGSKFWNNFQVIGFADAGAAWCGTSPMDSCNAYNTYTVENPPIRVVLDVERPPIVAGYGFGIRSYILGYFVRLDFAWGYEGGHIHPMKTYLSLSFDF